MRTAGQQNKTTTAPSTKRKTGAGHCTKSKTSSTEAARKTCKATGTINKVACELPSPSPTRLFNQEIQVLGASVQKAMAKTPAIAPGKCPRCFKKLKLQLFPIDDATRRGLEKDKHNPYVELTLGTQKKISSVVKHLNTKWSNSQIASGELMLLPYSARLKNLAGFRRWTVKDSSVNAADVHAAIGSPAIFRLRYGWFSNSKPESYGMPLTCSHSEGNMQSKENEEIFMTNEKEYGCVASIQQSGLQEMNVFNKKEHLSIQSQGDFPLSTHDLLNQGAGMTAVFDGSVQILSSMRMNNPPSLLWLDGVSNISCGALFSEASRALDNNHCHQLPVHNNSTVQQTAITCDSFDAAIAAHMTPFQGANPPTCAQVSQPSIWDAEETCQAFPFQMITSRKDAAASCSKASFTCGSQKDSPNVMGVCTLLDDAQVKAKDDASQEPTSNLEGERKADPYLDPTNVQRENKGDPCEQPTAGLQSSTELSSNGCNDLGKIDFSLSEYLGPWVNGVSSLRQILGGDSISLSGLIAGSLEALQNREIF